MLLAGVIPYRINPYTGDIYIAFVKAKATEALELPKGTLQESELNRLRLSVRNHFESTSGSLPPNVHAENLLSGKKVPEDTWYVL